MRAGRAIRFTLLARVCGHARIGARRRRDVRDAGVGVRSSVGHDQSIRMARDDKDTAKGGRWRRTKVEHDSGTMRRSINSLSRTGDRPCP